MRRTAEAVAVEELLDESDLEIVEEEMPEAEIQPELADGPSLEELSEIEIKEGLEKEEEEDAEGPACDIVRMYMVEAGRKAILTRAEEGVLGKKIFEAKGAYEIASTPENFRDLREAINVLVGHNLRLVISIAKKHQGRGLALLDLIQVRTPVIPSGFPCTWLNQ